MKRRIFLAGALVAIATAVAGWNFNQSENETMLSELGLANVEALAGGEGGNCRCEDFTSMACMNDGVMFFNRILVCD